MLNFDLKQAPPTTQEIISDRQRCRTDLQVIELRAKLLNMISIVTGVSGLIILYALFFFE